MITWPKDTTAAKNAFYGNFKLASFQAEHLTRIKPPFMMFYDKKPMKTGILVNKACAAAMMAAFTEIWDKCDHDEKKVAATGASDFGGCFNIRKIAGSANSWSNHSWACAIDLSPATNGFYQKGTIGETVVRAFKNTGAFWGGDYKGRRDDMHFEYVSR
jgi:hypothetical protein